MLNSKYIGDYYYYYMNKLQQLYIRIPVLSFQERKYCYTRETAGLCKSRCSTLLKIDSWLSFQSHNLHVI